MNVGRTDIRTEYIHIHICDIYIYIYIYIYISQIISIKSI